MPKRLFLAFLLVCSTTHTVFSWGFYAHELINRLAVFSLPIEMIGFYKYNIDYLTSHAVDPDKRRYAVDWEAPRHYIDIDVYGDSAIYTMPRYWNEAVEMYSEDTLLEYGIVPWHLVKMKYMLTKALQEKNLKMILKHSADLGHYVGDSNVPLHTTVNYNGQLTGQKGIHGLWESRLPELFAKDYVLLVGQATYVRNPQIRAWDAVTCAHLAKDSVLFYEKEVTQKLGQDRKYSFEQRGNQTVKVYSYDYCKRYHQELCNMVERQLKNSIKMVADFWYTCWVDAGQPDLNVLIDRIETKKEETEVLNTHEGHELIK